MPRGSTGAEDRSRNEILECRNIKGKRERMRVKEVYERKIEKRERKEAKREDDRGDTERER